MTIIIKLIKPTAGWFDGNINEWVNKHPEYMNYFSIIDNVSISIKIDRVTIGRSRENHITFSHPYETFPDISRKHATIIRQGANWFIVDEGSKYGTLIKRGNEAINVRASTEPIKLESGDQIILGKNGTTLYVSII